MKNVIFKFDTIIITYALSGVWWESTVLTTVGYY